MSQQMYLKIQQNSNHFKEHCANITTDARGLVKAEIKEMFGLWMKTTKTWRGGREVR